MGRSVACTVGVDCVGRGCSCGRGGLVAGSLVGWLFVVCMLVQDYVLCLGVSRQVDHSVDCTVSVERVGRGRILGRDYCQFVGTVVFVVIVVFVVVLVVDVVVVVVVFIVVITLLVFVVLLLLSFVCLFICLCVR